MPGGNICYIVLTFFIRCSGEAIRLNIGEDIFSGKESECWYGSLLKKRWFSKSKLSTFEMLLCSFYY